MTSANSGGRGNRQRGEAWIRYSILGHNRKGTTCSKLGEVPRKSSRAVLYEQGVIDSKASATRPSTGLILCLVAQLEGLLLVHKIRSACFSSSSSTVLT